MNDNWKTPHNILATTHYPLATALKTILNIVVAQQHNGNYS